MAQLCLSVAELAEAKLTPFTASVDGLPHHRVSHESTSNREQQKSEPLYSGYKESLQALRCVLFLYLVAQRTPLLFLHK